MYILYVWRCAQLKLLRCNFSTPLGKNAVGKCLCQDLRKVEMDVSVGEGKLGVFVVYDLTVYSSRLLHRFLEAGGTPARSQTGQKEAKTWTRQSCL